MRLLFPIILLRLFVLLVGDFLLPSLSISLSFVCGFALLDIGGFAAQVNKVKGNDVVCVVKNAATLAGSLFTLHASQIRIELPTLSDKDKQVCVGQKGDVCFVVSLSGAFIKGFFK